MFLRNYFLDSSKNPGSFVSHIRYCLIFKFLMSATVSGSRCRLADSLFILPQLFPFVKRFLKISFRKFWKRTALHRFREVFKTLAIWFCRPSVCCLTRQLVYITTDGRVCQQENRISSISLEICLIILIFLPMCKLSAFRKCLCIDMILYHFSGRFSDFYSCRPTFSA